MTMVNLIEGDNLEVMRSMESGSVDLIATDPPYQSGVDWKEFDDRLGLDEYLEFMRVRFVEMHRLLKKSGVLYVQCDQTASHYLKVELDKVFGRKNFLSDISWRRITKSLAGRRWMTNTDTILNFAKARTASYHRVVYESFKHSTMNRYKRDPDGTFYRDSSLEWKDPNPSPNLVYEFMGRWPDTRWIWTRERMKQAFDDGKIVEMASGNIRHKTPMDVVHGGRIIDNFWDDIPPFNSASTERVGYPTQKPLELYERMVMASCPPDGLVLDPFMGSGTTGVAAKNLSCRFVGIDRNPKAVLMAKNRIESFLI